MFLETLYSELRKALTTDSTDGTFASKIPTVTEPTGNGVIDLVAPGTPYAPHRILAMPYATAGNDDTFDVRVIGWNCIGTKLGQALTNRIWIPTILTQFSCTACTCTGVATGFILDTERFVDTVALTALIGEATVTANTTRTGTVEIYTPANNTPGWVIFPVRGMRKIEFNFDSTAAGATAMNCLFMKL